MPADAVDGRGGYVQLGRSGGARRGPRRDRQRPTAVAAARAPPLRRRPGHGAAVGHGSWPRGRGDGLAREHYAPPPGFHAGLTSTTSGPPGLPPAAATPAAGRWPARGGAPRRPTARRYGGRRGRGRGGGRALLAPAAAGPRRPPPSRAGAHRPQHGGGGWASGRTHSVRLTTEQGGRSLSSNTSVCVPMYKGQTHSVAPGGGRWAPALGVSGRPPRGCADSVIGLHLRRARGVPVAAVDVFAAAAHPTGGGGARDGATHPPRAPAGGVLRAPDAPSLWAVTMENGHREVVGRPVSGRAPLLPLCRLAVESLHGSTIAWGSCTRTAVCAPPRKPRRAASRLRRGPVHPWPGLFQVSSDPPRRGCASLHNNGGGGGGNGDTEAVNCASIQVHTGTGDRARAPPTWR